MYGRLCKLPESKKGVFGQQWVNFWFKGAITYSAPVKRKRYSSSAPKITGDPDGEIKSRPLPWNKQEAAFFESLGIVGGNRSQTTYVAAFLSC